MICNFCKFESSDCRIFRNKNKNCCWFEKKPVTEKEIKDFENLYKFDLDWDQSRF